MTRSRQIGVATNSIERSYEKGRASAYMLGATRRFGKMQGYPVMIWSIILMTQAGVPRLLGDDSRRMYDMSKRTAAVNDLYIPRMLADEMVPRKWEAKLQRALVGAFCHDYDIGGPLPIILSPKKGLGKKAAVFSFRRNRCQFVWQEHLIFARLRIVWLDSLVQSHIIRRHHRGEVLTDDIIFLANINKVAALICSHLCT